MINADSNGVLCANGYMHIACYISYSCSRYDIALFPLYLCCVLLAQDWLKQSIQNVKECKIKIQTGAYEIHLGCCVWNLCRNSLWGSCRKRPLSLPDAVPSTSQACQTPASKQHNSLHVSAVSQPWHFVRHDMSRAMHGTCRASAADCRLFISEAGELSACTDWTGAWLICNTCICRQASMKICRICDQLHTRTFICMGTACAVVRPHATVLSGLYLCSVVVERPALSLAEMDLSRAFSMLSASLVTR